jgi:heme O synthase-like polyprenyltransferase
MFGQSWNEVIEGCVTTTQSGAQIARLTCLPAVFQNIFTFAIIAAGVVAVIFIIYAGFRYVTSEGDQKRIDSARKTLTWSIIGLIIVIMAYFIVSLIGVITGTGPCITEFGFNNPNCQ